MFLVSISPNIRSFAYSYYKHKIICGNPLVDIMVLVITYFEVTKNINTKIWEAELKPFLLRSWRVVAVNLPNCLGDKFWLMWREDLISHNSPEIINVLEFVYLHII